VEFTLQMREIYEALSPRGNDMHTKLQRDWYKHSSNIKFFTLTMWDAAVFMLLMGGIYEARRLDGFRWHDIHIMFHNIRFRWSRNICRGVIYTDSKVISQTYPHSYVRKVGLNFRVK
jgi:hypothetical protein